MAVTVDRLLLCLGVALLGGSGRLAASLTHALYLYEIGVSVPAPDVPVTSQCSLPGANKTGTAGATSQSPGRPAGPRAAP